MNQKLCFVSAILFLLFANQAFSATITITLDGVDLIKTAAIGANSTASFELKQVLTTTKIIAGFASAITVSFHISGVEIV